MYEIKKVSLVVSCLFLSVCVSSSTKYAQTASECETASVCRVSGLLEMNSDGHGFIGDFTLPDGSCINVSLPEEQSKKLLGNSPVKMEIQGSVLPFPFGENILFFKVNGRRVGFGNCSDFYIFVKD